MQKAKHILFAGGGSGGHIAPLLAVMEAVQSEDASVRCSYVGLPTDLESPLIKESKLSFDTFAVQAGKLHRHVTLDHFRQLGKFAAGLYQADRLVASLKPDVVMCKGSMLSVPIAFAAWRKGIPVYSHETDLVSGLANRMISRIATTIFTAFPTEAYAKLPQGKLVHTGQPVREAFRKAKSEHNDLPMVTVIGGSQGARAINQLVSKGWGRLLSQVRLTHLCGARDFESLQKAAEVLDALHRERLYLAAFDPNTPELFAQSVVVVTRSGGTIAELAAARKAVIAIPLSTAAQNHQWANARFLDERGAAIVVDETKVESDELVELIFGLVGDPSRRDYLEEHIAALDRPQAAMDMAHILLR